MTKSGSNTKLPIWTESMLFFFILKQFYLQYKSTKILTRSDKKNNILSVQMLTIQYTNKQYGGSVKCHLDLQNNEQQITDSDLPKQTARIFFVLVHHTNEVTYIRQFQHTPVYAIVTWSY